jgi:hypothetical protein
MTSISPSQAAPAIAVLGIIVLALARRTYRLSTGVPYSPLGLFGYGGFSSILFVLFGASTLYVAVGTWGPVGLALVAPYAGVVALAAFVAKPRVERRVHFETREGGALYYRLPVVIPVLSLVLFGVRIAVEVVLLGLQVLVSFTVPSTLAPTALAILIGADLLYGSSVGLLIGRGLGVRGAHASYVGQPHPLP